jgi:predicted nuclease with RNAse H fold
MLFPSGDVETSCVDCAEEAVEFVNNAKKDHAIGGVGVDAPLWWSSGQSSDRQADKMLRRHYGLSSGSVQTANSLRGAVLVQSMLFVDRLRARLGRGIPVTESHPKALRRVLQLDDWQACCARFGVVCNKISEHEQDAVMGAVAAREGFSGRWHCDLSNGRDVLEQDPKAYWLAPVHYFWPEKCG